MSFPFSVIRYKSFPLYFKENVRIIIEHIFFSTFTAAFKRNYSIFLTIECKILKMSFPFLHIWQCDATKTVRQGSILCFSSCLPTSSQGFFPKTGQLIFQEVLVVVFACFHICFYLSVQAEYVGKAVTSWTPKLLSF